MSKTKVSSLIQRKMVLTGLPPADRDLVLRSIVEGVADAGGFAPDSAQTVYRAILKRERMGSTGIGRGVAIPHCKTSAVETPLVAYARTTEPVDYGATDGARVHSFFLVASPLKAPPEDHVEILRWIAKLARSEYYSNLLRTTSDPDSLYELFGEIDGGR